MSDNITTLKTAGNNFVWINIVNAQKDELSYLRKKYKFIELDLRDSMAKNIAQRPKFYIRNSYSFLILQFPVYNKKTRTVDAEEVDFFIGSNFIITCHKNNLPPLVELFNMCMADKFYREQYLSGDNITLLYEIVVRLQEYCYPIMDHLSLDIKNIEDNIFNEREREVVREILLIKRNILNFRKIMEAHKSVLQKLAKTTIAYLRTSQMKSFYSDLIEHTKNIWDILSGQKEMIEALEDTNSSLISFKLNDIMRTLTVFSVIVFPLTLLAAIFGMNTVESMPFINDRYGFEKIIAIMLVGASFMFIFFKRKRWI
ncbi:MAG: magnesium transporter CorA family protein [Candidatus Buchananbacteria bacterium]|jgi:magnesium transporter